MIRVLLYILKLINNVDNKGEKPMQLLIPFESKLRGGSVARLRKINMYV